jgi:hypothetical protein
MKVFANRRTRRLSAGRMAPFESDGAGTEHMGGEVQRGHQIVLVETPYSLDGQAFRDRDGHHRTPVSDHLTSSLGLHLKTSPVTSSTSSFSNWPALSARPRCSYPQCSISVCSHLFSQISSSRSVDSLFDIERRNERLQSPITLPPIQRERGTVCGSIE